MKRLRFKRIDITQDQAEELESIISEYLDEPGPISAFEDEFSSMRGDDVKDMLKQLKVPKVVVKTIVARLENIGGDISNLQHNGDINRDVIDDLSQELKAFDEFLGKLFNVKRARTKKPYIWQVWT